MSVSVSARPVVTTTGSSTWQQSGTAAGRGGGRVTTPVRPTRPVTHPGVGGDEYPAGQTRGARHTPQGFCSSGRSALYRQLSSPDVLLCLRWCSTFSGCRSKVSRLILHGANRIATQRPRHFRLRLLLDRSDFCCRNSLKGQRYSPNCRHCPRHQCAAHPISKTAWGGVSGAGGGAGVTSDHHWTRPAHAFSNRCNYDDPVPCRGGISRHATGRHTDPG